MPSSTDHANFLSSWVQKDKKIITYRLLSRELRIHVDDAKQALTDFFNSYKDKSELDCTYILIGRSKSTETKAVEAVDDKDDDTRLVGSSSTASSSTAPARSFLDSRVTRRQTEAEATRQVIRLVPADQLDQAKSSLADISSCHIYSISPGRLVDAAQLTAVQHDLHSQQRYADVWQQTNRGADLGVIINSSIEDNYDPSKAIPSLGAPSAPALAASRDAKPAKISAIKTEVKQEPDAKPATATAKSTPSASAGSKKGGGLDWSRARPKEAEAKSTAKKEAANSSKRPSTRKSLLGSDDEDEDVGRNARKPAVIDDDDDDEEDDKPEKLGYADDESEDGDIEMADPIQGAAPRGTGKRADARSQTKAQEAAQRKELEAMMDSDDDDEVQVVEPSGTSGSKKTGQAKDLDPDVDMADTTVTDTMNGSESVPQAAKRRVRKKRKIGSKKIRTKDERGYTVTKTVDEYESYSSEESDAPVVVGSKRGAGAGTAKSQPKPAPESRSTSTSASASPAPSAPSKATPASNNATNRKPSGGATSTPAKKGQQSLNSFFTRKPKN